MNDETISHGLADLLCFDEAPPQPEPLQDPRLLTIFRVGKLTTHRFEELCLVRHVGVGGIIAHLNAPLVPRQRVRIEFRSDRKFWGTVLWVKDGTVGIGYDTQIGIEEALSRGEGTSGRRTAGPRLHIDCNVQLRVGGRYYRVRAHDIGQCGIGIVANGIWEDDQAVVVMLDGFRPIHGTMLWCHGDLIGIRFNQPIPFGDLTGWLQDRFGRSWVETHGRDGRNPGGDSA